MRGPVSKITVAKLQRVMTASIKFLDDLKHTFEEVVFKGVQWASDDIQTIHEAHSKDKTFSPSSGK